MKKLILFLILVASYFGEVQAQTACADLVGTTGVLQENSTWGLIDVYNYDCLDDILLDPSCSVGASDYHMRVAEFDLTTGEWTKDYHSGWEGMIVPTTIRVSDYFPANEPTCGKIYAVGFTEGPAWNPADVRFFTIDCTDIALEETYACKADIEYNDLETRDKAHDQLLLDDGTRVITGTTHAGGEVRLFIEELDPAGNTIRKQAYPIQGDDVSNVQMILDQQTDEYILLFDTRISNNRDVYFARINRAILTSVQYYGPVVNDIAGASFSNEYAVKIEDDLRNKYMLVVNQQIPGEQNSYVVMVDKTLSYAYCPSFIQINGSKQIVSHDIIETGGRINDQGCPDETSYLLVGSVDNFAFVAGLTCNGVLLTNTNIFDIDGNPATTDPAKRIQYYDGNFYIAGEVGTSLTPPISGKIWLGSFSFNDEFYAGLNWLKIYEKNTGKKESLTDLDYSDESLYLTGQTEIEDVSVALPGSIVGAKAYIFSTDLNGNPIWSKEYAENPDTESYLCDIELQCGAIYGVGACNDRIFVSDPDIPGGSSIANRNFDIYRNKTNRIGELSGDECYKEIPFEPIDTQVPIELVQNEPFGECIERPPLDGIFEDLVCVVDCCAQPKVFDCGEAAVTYHSASNPSGHVMGIKNVRDKSPAPLGSNWIPPVYMHPDWTATNMGEVFGIAIDNNDNIYLTATNIYPGSSVGTAGDGGIYKVDAYTGNVSNFASLPNSPGVGLGNICYDERNDQFFATNFEDGIIYRLSTSGTTLSMHDPFAADTGTNGCAPLGEILWGVGIYKNTVYFGRWNNDLSNSGTGQNEIYSINLDCTGNFDPTSVANLEITMPAYHGSTTSSPVSDIAFAEDGRMLLAERSQRYCTSVSAHQSRVLEYTFSGGTWNFAQEFFIGNYNVHKNSAGGVDYGYDDFLQNAPPPLPECDAYVWASGDALILSGGVAVYGITGIPSSGNSPPPAPSAPLNSIYIDADGDVATGDKTQIGDVEIFKCGGCCEVSCDSLDVTLTNTSMQSDSCCYQVDITNNHCNEIISMEAEVMTPGWQFNTANLSVNAGWNGTPFPNKIRIDYNSGTYPTGTTNNLMTFCLVNNVQNPLPPSTQSIKFTWYELVGCDTTAICETIETTHCEPSDPPPSPCAELVDINISCDSIPGVYKMTFFVSNYNTTNTATNLLLHSLIPGAPQMYFRNTPSGTDLTSTTIPINVPPVSSNGPYTVYVYSSTPITSATNVYFNIGLINSQFCCHPPVPVCVQLEPCPCIETSIVDFVCVPDSSKYRLTFTVTNKSTTAPNATGLYIDVKNAPYFVPTNFFDWTSNPLAYNASRTITTCVEPFPITDPNLILEYTIHHTINQPWDSCCTSTVLDTIPIPICCDSTELVIDGDFDDPTGSSFTSGLPQNCTCTVGSWCIGTTPRDKCNNAAWGTFGAPVGCSPNFLIVDAGAVPSILWSQPVTVNSGSTYEFSFWYYPNVSGTGTPNLNIRLDGNSIGSATGVVNTWTKYTFSVTAPITSIVPLTITQTTNSGNGDFAIDHISFREDCDPEPEPECCTNFEAFCDRVDTGFAVAFNDPTNCTVGVSPLALNECDQVRWVWGDGTVSNGTWNTSATHTYPSSGTYTICMIVAEVDSNGEICWEKEFCRTIEVNCLQWEYCDPVIDLGTLALPTGTIHAGEEVISSGTIPQGTDVSLKAGQSIRLENGFRSDANADLEILIEDCVPDNPE